MKPLFSIITIVLLLSATTGVAAQNDNLSGHYFTPEVTHISTNIHIVDPLELNLSRAGFAPLAFVVGVASIDLALMGFYYGAYIPYYMPKERIHYSIN